MIRHFLYETGRYLMFLRLVFRRPEKWRLSVRQFFIEAEKLVINSIPLIALISAFIGAIYRCRSGHPDRQQHDFPLPAEDVHRIHDP